MPAGVSSLVPANGLPHRCGADSAVGLSAARARRRYGIPRGIWWNALGIALVNMVMRLRRSSFRSFLHPPDAIEAIVRGYGFRRQYLRDTLVWRVAVYAR